MPASQKSAPTSGSSTATEIDYVEIPEDLADETIQFVMKDRIKLYKLSSDTCRLRHRLFTESPSELTDCADVFASIKIAIKKSIALEESLREID